MQILFSRGRAVTTKQRLIHGAIRFVSRSPLVHCAVASDGTVLSATYKNVLAYDAADYLYKTPELEWAIDVPDGFGLIEWHGKRPPLICPCTVITNQVLRSAGVMVPRRIITPARLFDWLRAQGYTLHAIGTDQSSADGRGHWAWGRSIDSLVE